MERFSIEDLVRQAKKGDRSAYNELVRAYSRYVFAVCMGVLGDCHDAEDLTQEVFIKGFRELHSLNQDNKFKQWLGMMARNLCVDYIRQNVKLRQSLAKIAEDTDGSDGDFEPLKDAIARLDAMYREPLVMYYFDGRQISSVAKSLGLKNDAVRTRLVRARKKLRQILSGGEDE